MSYNSGVHINRQSGPPSAMLTQINPDKQTRNTFFADNVRETNISSVNPYPGVFDRKRAMPIVEPTYDQHIIKPAKSNVTHGRIPFIEVISSCDRNYEHYPNSGEYQIKLKDTYTNVTSVSLFNACIPVTFYKINRNNNLIYFQERYGTTLVAAIPEGDYSNEELKEAIQKALNDVGENAYMVIYDNITGKLTIKSNLEDGDHIFRLIFKGKNEVHQYSDRFIYPCNSIGKVAGFAVKDLQYAKGKSNLIMGDDVITGDHQTEYLTDFSVGDAFYVEKIDQVFTVKDVIDNQTMQVESTADETCTCVLLNKGSYTGQHKVNLCPLNCIVLDILELENIRSNTRGVDRAFSVIPLYPVRNQTSFVLSTALGHSVYVKYFNPPLARLDRFTVKFKDLDGNIVDFNGVDHLLEFRINTINAPGAYDPGSRL